MSRETTAPSLESWVNSPDACCFGLYLKWCFISYFVWKLTFFTFTRRLYKDQTWQSYLKMIYFSRMIVSWKQDQEHNFVGIYITCFCIWEGGPSYFNDIKLYILHVILFVHVPLFKKNITRKPRSYITSLWVLCWLLGRYNSERKLLLDFIQKVVLWATTQSMKDLASGSTIQLELTGNENNGGKYKKWNFIRNIVYILSS